MKPTFLSRPALAGLLALAAAAAQATTYYVATNGNDSAAGTSPATAVKSIQVAVNKALVAGDAVLVGPGTYNTGSFTVAGAGVSRVAITRDITVRSTRGAAQTTILGKAGTGSSAPFGSGVIRCVYISAGTLDGFTLRNGFADASSFPPTYAKDNPVINGGGVFAPLNNQAAQVNNCIIIGCGAYRGGGAYWGTLNNCTVVSNHVNTTSGDGVWSSLVRNSIVMYNGDENYSSASNSVDKTVFQHSCTTPFPSSTIYGADHNGGGNTASDPAFMPGTLCPSNGSACVNSGNNAYVDGGSTNDAAGNPRIIAGTVDMGAYENTYVAYPLTVNSGTGSGFYTNHAVVAISANAPAAGYQFGGWTGDIAYLANPALASTTVTMPTNAVTVTATYTLIPHYTLTVVSGSGDGSYLAGAVVPIAADAAPVWSAFDRWTGDTNGLANVTSATTTVTMPAHDATLTATYTAPDLSEIVGDLLGLPQPLTFSNVAPADASAEPPQLRLGPATDHENAFEASVTAVYTNAGTVIFPWRVSCEAGWDKLVFSVDGVEKATLTGLDVSAVVTQFVAGAGAHVLTWAYVKDDSAFDGEDCGWLEPVTWIPDDLAAELGAAGKPLAFPFAKSLGLPGAPLPFPYGFEACYLDRAAPAGATNGAAARLGGLKNGAPLVGDNQTNAVEAVVHGAGTLSFRWYTMCQVSDYLICTIDGVEAARLGGLSSKTGGWKTFTTNLLSVADHVVRWSYVKNASGFDNQDCGWVDSVVWLQSAHELTVESGVIVATGLTTGTFAVGDAVAIAAAAPAAGMEFDEWDGDTENLADPAAANTTVTMPARAITVRALYKVKTLGVSVINGRDAGAWPNAAHPGTGEPEGTYPAGALVRIVANPAPLWQTFAYWTNTVGAAIFSNRFAEISMFVMPAEDVSITAVYRDQTPAERLASALTIRGQPLTVAAFSPSGVVAEASGGIRYRDPVVKLGGPSVGPGQSAFLTITNFTGNGYLRFWWRGDAEDRYDGLQVYVNGALWPRLYSEKDTNRYDDVTWWTLSTAPLANVSNITWRFTCDDTYEVHNHMVLLDRVTWIPDDLVYALDAGWCVPNINAENDPLFDAANDMGGWVHEGEDGGVAWDESAPGGGAVRIGGFGYVTNNQLAQVSVTNWGTGILSWQWTTRSEATYDRLEFMLGSEPKRWISGKGDGTWSDSSYVVRTDVSKSRPENRSLKRILNYRYKKDADVSVFEDCGWLRDVAWTPTFALQLTAGTNVSYTLPSEFLTISDLAGLYGEAQHDVFPPGTIVNIVGNSPPGDNYFFDRWVGDAASLALLADQFSRNQTFAMPDFDVSLTATYTTTPPTVPTYSLTVINGQGGGLYTNGATVAILANTPPAGYVFTGWSGSGASRVANRLAPSTTLSMIAAHLMVEATYLALPVESIIPLAIGVPGPVTAANIPVENVSQDPPLVALGPLADGQTAFFECCYTNAGTVIFPWAVDSEQGYDVLSFSVDGVVIASISGVDSGTITNFVAGDGPHLLRWSYAKDGVASAGSDSGAVGAVTWIPDALASEFGVSGKPLFFPSGSSSVSLDGAPPSGAISNVAARLGSPSITDGADVATEAVFYGSGNLSFHWRISSELGHDFLILTIDGAEAARISGTRDGWLLFETNLLTVSSHVVRWTYAKDSSRAEGSDCGWVDSVAWSQFRYDLVVDNGSGDGTYAVGQSVNVVADPAPAGQEFDIWDGDTDTLADPHASATTLIMPATHSLIRALYKSVTLTVTVVNGREAGAWPNSVYESTGEPEGSYPAGAEIRIVANAAPLWQTFEHWVSTNGAAFAASNSPITTFTMPSNPVTVMAIYRNQTEVEKLAGALTIAGQDLTITGYSPSGVVASATGGVRYGDPVAKLGGSSVGPGQSVGLTTTSFTGSGVLLYWWKSSSESRYDGVRLAVNGVLQGPVHSGKDTQWHLSTNFVTGAASIEWRFVRDTSYFVRDNTILVDRVTWLPSDMLTALGDANFVPNVNDESSGFHGEDGGVAWASDAPGGLSAVRLGRFGYVNNDQLGQLSLRRVGTGILLWTWAACSEADYDSLLFRPDIYTNQWMSGKEEAWFSTGYAVTNILTRTRPDNSQIVHKLNFAYKKDGDTSVLKDNTWLRAVSWTPTILFTLTYGTLNSYTIPPQFLFLQPVLDEALLGFYPQGTIVSVSAPSLSGSAFAYWAGGPNIDTVLGANRYVSSPTFALPGHDFTMTPIYTNLVVSPSPVVPKQSKITNLSVQPPALAAAEAKPGAFASAPASGWVTLTFEGAPDSDYAIVWSPALVGPECVWQPVPASYREVLGDTEDGKRLFRISAEVQAAGPACFFRVEAR